METFFSLNRSAPFLVREGVRENCFGVKKGMPHYIGIRKGLLAEHAGRIQYVRGIHEMADGIWLVPHRKADYSRIALRNDLYVFRNGGQYLDNFAHEQSLVIETRSGLVIFNSCSHTDMTHILADVSEMLGRRDVCAYVGGLHLYRLTDDELHILGDEISSASIAHVFTGHCIGDPAFSVLNEALGDRINQFSSGYTDRFV
jgi:7,8-dihydropterin-6-yl-methyl-4-(beta-D-ribofuranosyl)aminobenzene 5'-phosphate synthase